MGLRETAFGAAPVGLGSAALLKDVHTPTSYVSIALRTAQHASGLGLRFGLLHFRGNVMEASKDHDCRSSPSLSLYCARRSMRITSDVLPLLQAHFSVQDMMTCCLSRWKALGSADSRESRNEEPY